MLQTERYRWKAGVPVPYTYRDSGTSWGAINANHYGQYLNEKYQSSIQESRALRQASVDNTAYTASVPFNTPRQFPPKPSSDGIHRNANGKIIPPPRDIPDYPYAPTYNPYMRIFYEPDNVESRAHRKAFLMKTEYERNFMMTGGLDVEATPTQPESSPEPTQPAQLQRPPMPSTSRPPSRSRPASRPGFRSGSVTTRVMMNEADMRPANNNGSQTSRGRPNSNIVYYKGKLSEMISAGDTKGIAGSEKEKLYSLHLNRMR